MRDTMKDNDIFNALECCVNLDSCSSCPLNADPCCRGTLIEQSLHLIKRKQERIAILESGVMPTKVWEEIMRNVLSPLVAKAAEDKAKEIVGDTELQNMDVH